MLVITSVRLLPMMPQSLRRIQLFRNSRRLTPRSKTPWETIKIDALVLFTSQALCVCFSKNVCFDNVVSNSSKINMSVRFRVAVTSDILQNAMGATPRQLGQKSWFARRCATHSRMIHNIVVNIDTLENLLTRFSSRATANRHDYICFSNPPPNE